MSHPEKKQKTSPFSPETSEQAHTPMHDVGHLQEPLLAESRHASGLVVVSPVVSAVSRIMVSAVSRTWYQRYLGLGISGISDLVSAISRNEPVTPQ